MTITDNTTGQPYAPATFPLDPDLTAFFGFETRLEENEYAPFNQLYTRYLTFCAEGAIASLEPAAFAAKLVTLPGVALDAPITDPKCWAEHIALASDSTEDVAVEDAPARTPKDRALHVATNIAVALMLLCGGLVGSITNKDLLSTVFFTAAVVYVLCVDWR